VPARYFSNVNWVQQTSTDLKGSIRRGSLGPVSRLRRIPRMGGGGKGRFSLKRTPGRTVIHVNPPAYQSDLLALIFPRMPVLQTRAVRPVKPHRTTRNKTIRGSRAGRARSRYCAAGPTTFPETGSSFDMETRIDQPLSLAAPTPRRPRIEALVATESCQAMLEVQSTERSPDGVFVRNSFGVALRGSFGLG